MNEVRFPLESKFTDGLFFWFCFWFFHPFVKQFLLGIMKLKSFSLSYTDCSKKGQVKRKGSNQDLWLAQMLQQALNLMTQS